MRILLVFLLLPLGLFAQPGPLIVHPIQGKILLEKTRYQQGDVVQAVVTGTVMTDGSCDSAPRYWIRSMDPDTGPVVDPCTARQMDCGLGSVLWVDKAVELDLADRVPGGYTLAVCGVGEVEFEIIE